MSAPRNSEVALASPLTAGNDFRIAPRAYTIAKNLAYHARVWLRAARAARRPPRVVVSEQACSDTHRHANV